MKLNDQELDAQADELAAMIDALVSQGSEHINLKIGEATKVQTINSTDCSGTLGACAIPTFFNDNEESNNTEARDDEEF